MNPSDITAPDHGGASGVLRARFDAAASGRTALERVFERGALRLRVPRGPDCQGVIVNTGGGVVGGDSLAIAVALGAGGALTLTTVAAEKVYRSAGPDAAVATTLDVATEARLDWLPQETILFDGCRLRRTLSATLAGSARLLAAETLVFGRLASAETAMTGAITDGWRVRRDGRLLFADETRLEGAIGATLDRPAVGGGARAVGLLLLCAPDAEVAVEPLRALTAPFATGDEAVAVGVSARDGVLILRALARSPLRLRACMLAAIGASRAAPNGASALARIWA